MSVVSKEREWADRARRFVKAELRRAEVSYAELARRLGEHGLEETEASIAGKLNRGTLGFVLLALYIDPTGLARLNPFGGEECAPYEQQHTLSEEQQPQKRLSSGEGRETGAERNAHGATATAQDQQSAQGDYYACRLAVYTRQLAVFTALLVAATTLLFAIGIYQGVQLGRHASHMERSVETSRAALVTTQRAFLFLDEFYVDQGPTGFIIKPQWRNSGKTPPKNMTIRTNWKSLEGDLPDDFDYHYDKPAAKMFVGPEAQEWSAPVLIPLNIVNIVNRGTSKIYFWGRVDYLDIFDNTQPHFTEWCYRVYSAPNQSNWQFVAYGDYNRSD
jgi:hypothetical protein